MGANERAALEDIVNIAIRSGWRVIRHPTSPWYAVELAQGSEDDLAAIKRDLYLRGRPVEQNPSKKEGMSLQSMWGITLFIVIALFTICLLLVFTSELRITPQ
jgi:hypothetical protein